MQIFHLQNTYYYIEHKEEFDELEESHLSEWKGIGFYKFYIHYRFDTCQYDFIPFEDYDKIWEEVSESERKILNLRACLIKEATKRASIYSSK